MRRILRLAPLLLACASTGAAQAPEPTELTAPAVERWLDGFMTHALLPGDLAGAVVVVARDTTILLAKGYGWADVEARKPVDPAATLFRPGSISKVFTWLAVMQLVEQGKLDLDRDVQDYLDFPLRGGYAEPITLRRIMTHTAGYEETLKDFYTLDSTRAQPLGRYLALRQPQRIYPPGSTPAYSNYASALAGYVVERVAGQPFERYVEERIFEPLQMRRSTFQQPLPAELAPLMSRGYLRASEPPYPFEIFGPGPAGGLSATGGDMGRFMLAMMNGGVLEGRRVVRSETLDTMFAREADRFPSFPGSGLGWRRRDRNGRRAVEHGGDTRPFHAGLRLLLDDRAGIYVVFNSLGRGGAVFDARTALLDGFVDTFFPPRTPFQAPPTASTAAAHARLAEGRYLTSRRWESSFLSLVSLGPATVSARDDGTITVSSITGLDGAAKVWREIGDWIWIDGEGQDRLGMTVEGGRVTRIMQADDPATELLRLPWWRNPGLVLPLVGGSLAVLVATILAWPLGALIRRRHRLAPPAHGGRGRRLARLVAILLVGLIVGWGLFAGQLLANNLGFFRPEVDWLLRLLSLLGLAATLATVWLAVHTARTWREGSAAGRLGRALVAAAAIVVVLFAWSSHLVTASVAY